MAFRVLHLFRICCGGSRNDDIQQNCKEKRKMNEFMNTIAAILEIIANFGAGAVSHGIGYEPELPEELRK